MSALAKDPRRRPAAQDLLNVLTRPVILSAPTTGGTAAPARQVLIETWPTTARQADSSLLLEPGTGPGTELPRTRRDPGRRRAVLIVVPAVAGAAVLAMLVSLMTGHGLYFGRLAASQLASQDSPQSLWTSPDGTSWTLAATHGIAPQLPGDGVWVITRTAQGFLAAGAGGGQAVIWTSRDGLNWRRLTAAQLGLAGPGETVQSISYASYHGDATVIAGQVASGGTTYSGTWLSTDGGSSWARVAIPAGHGAGTQISGLAFDAQGLIAVRAGQSASGTADGVAYFSPNGLAWQYAGTIDPDPDSGGWTPMVVKGSDYGFVVSGNTRTGKIVAYTSTGTGGTWRPTGALGETTAESVTGVTLAPGGTVVAVGSAAKGKLSQRPVFLVADAAGKVRPISLPGIPGALVPELMVNGLAASGGQMVAVGSADGYPAVWRRPANGSWSLVTRLSLVSGYPGLTALTSVTHGAAGWLAGAIVTSAAKPLAISHWR